MSTYELKPIREREAKATPGPWNVVLVGVGDREQPYAIEDASGNDVLDLDGFECEGLIISAEDLEFIIKGRQDIPALLSEIDRREKERVALMTALRASAVGNVALEKEIDRLKREVNELDKGVYEDRGAEHAWEPPYPGEVR